VLPLSKARIDSADLLSTTVVLETLLTENGHEVTHRGSYLYIPDPGYEMRETITRYVRVLALVDYDHRLEAKSAGFSWDDGKRVWYRDISEEELSTTGVTYPFRVEAASKPPIERHRLEAVLCQTGSPAQDQGALRLSLPSRGAGRSAKNIVLKKPTESGSRL